MSDEASLAGVRSILETPILDEHKWAKVPTLATDAVLLDLEDSVSAERKDQARTKVLDFLGRSAYFGSRLPIPRTNPLGTPWGETDLQALAQSGTRVLAYPKCAGPEELQQVREILAAEGAQPGLVVIIETAAAVLGLERIAAAPGVAGLILGPNDLAVDAGWQLFADGRLFADAYHYPKAKLALAGAAYGIPVYDTAFVPRLGDLDQVRAVMTHDRRLGFAGSATFYPPHLDVINQIFTPSAEERTAAERVVAAYEHALAEGSAAVQQDGQAVILQDYKRALQTLGKTTS
jgi:citrate lyase beta subunit